MPKKIKVNPEEWVERRKKGIGGSDVAAILRVHPYKSIFDVWCEKVGIENTHKEHQELDPKSIPVRCGKLKEPLVRELYEEHTGRRGILNPGMFVSDLEGEEWCFSNPDWITGPGTIEYPAPIERGCELKCVSPYLSRDWEGTPPIYYATQCVWYMKVLKVETWDLCGLIGDQSLALYELHRDLELEREIFQVVEEFWNYHVKEKKEPSLDSSDGCLAYLHKKYAKRGAGVRKIEENDPAVALMAEYRELKKKEAWIEQQVKLKSAQLIEAVGLDKAIQCGPLKANYVSFPTPGIKYREIVEFLNPEPEVIAKFSVPGQTNYIRVTDARDKKPKAKTITESSQRENFEVE